MDRGLKDNLKSLHELHRQYQDVREELDRGPKLVRARQAATQQKQADLDAQRDRQKHLRMTADKKSLQLKTNEAKIEDLRAKLNQASSNREYDALRTQIDADKMANSVLEDEILEALEQVDGCQMACKRLEQELAACKQEEERITKEVAATETRLRDQATELGAALADAEKHLPGEAITIYRRLVQAHGAGALSEVTNKVCSACYVQLPPQMFLQLKSGHLLFCKTCGRLLYPGEDD